MALVRHALLGYLQPYSTLEAKVAQINKGSILGFSAVVPISKKGKYSHPRAIGVAFDPFVLSL